jgi:TRAP-type C4-dicarboxylate transport system permease small subunit
MRRQFLLVSGRAVTRNVALAGGGSMTDALKKALEESAVDAGFAEDIARFRYGDHGIEDWISVAILWAMSIFVFLQFVTRYLFNNSLAWTEEISSYLLICLTFIGSAMAVRKNTHIQIEFLYTIVSYRTGLILALFVDVLRIAFLALSTYLAYQVMVIMQFQYMAVVDWPLSYVYGGVFLGYVAMTIRAVQVIVRHWRTKSSELMVAGVGPSL